MVAPKGNTYNNNYKPEYVEQVYKLCLLNAIDRELTDFFEVNVDTIRNWSIRHPEFDAAKRLGKMKADAEVASQLFSRAIGCTVKKQRVLNNGAIVDYTKSCRRIPVPLSIGCSAVTAINGTLSSR